MEVGAAGQDSGVETECDIESNDSSMSSVSVGGGAQRQDSGGGGALGGQNAGPSNPSSPDNTQQDARSRADMDSSDTGSLPLPPLPPAEDGYLGDCSSDGGNEKNFPMPLDRLNKPMSCACHPSRFSLPPSPSTGSVDPASLGGVSGATPSCSSGSSIAPVPEEVEPPAGLQFTALQQGLPQDFPTTAYGYQLLTHRDWGGSSLRTKIKSSGFRSKYNGSLVQDDWSRVKAAIAERKLRVAANMNNTELVERLIAGGTNVRGEDEHKRTALHFAAAKGFTEVVQLLLRHGADPDQKDMLGNTALHLAACTNHVPVVTLLLRAGTDVTTLDNNGRTPLQLAQAKLKILQRNTCQTSEMSKVKAEVNSVLEMMREYLSRFRLSEGETQGNAWSRDVCSQLIDSFSQRLTLHKTHNDLNTDLRQLLDSLGSLSISSSQQQQQQTETSSSSTVQ